MRLEELDTTGVKNWLGRRRDAFLAGALGNKTAEGRFKMNLIVKKLTDAYKVFLGGHGMQPSPQSLSIFIDQFFPDYMPQLQRQFPSLLSSSSAPATQAAASSAQSAPASATPNAAATPTTAASASPATAASATPASGTPAAPAAANSNVQQTTPAAATKPAQPAQPTGDIEAEERAHKEWEDLRKDFDFQFGQQDTTDAELETMLQKAEQFAAQSSMAHGWVNSYLISKIKSDPNIRSQFPGFTKALASWLSSPPPGSTQQPSAPSPAAATAPQSTVPPSAPTATSAATPPQPSREHPTDADGNVIQVGNKVVKVRNIRGRTPPEGVVTQTDPNGRLQIRSGKNFYTALHPNDWRVTESRRGGARLVEAPPYQLNKRSAPAAGSPASGAPAAPRPPGVSGSPPDFLQRQRSNPQAVASKLSPAQINQIMTALGRMLNMNGQAKVNMPQAGQNTAAGQHGGYSGASNRGMGSRGGRVDASRLFNMHLDPHALARAGMRVHANERDLHTVEQFIMQQPGQTATVKDILTKMKTPVSTSVLSAILVALGHY